MILRPIQQRSRLTQLTRSSERVPRPRLVITGLIERARPILYIPISQLSEVLAQGPHRRQQVTEVLVHVLRMIEDATGMNKTPQRSQCFKRISTGINERRHEKTSLTSNVAKEVRRKSWYCCSVTEWMPSGARGSKPQFAQKQW